MYGLSFRRSRYLSFLNVYTYESAHISILSVAFLTMPSLSLSVHFNSFFSIFILDFPSCSLSICLSVCLSFCSSFVPSWNIFNLCDLLHLNNSFARFWCPNYLHRAHSLSFSLLLSKVHLFQLKASLHSLASRLIALFVNRSCVNVLHYLTAKVGL